MNMTAQSGRFLAIAIVIQKIWPRPTPVYGWDAAIQGFLKMCWFSVVLRQFLINPLESW